ncbi:MAG: pilus assembly protein PilM [Chloroflexi bacterium]|nr:pilus assembly protein PilM [Chloroflexota bacterium]
MVTIEIDSTVIRLMETAGRKVIRWASHSLEPGMFESEVISDPIALGALVRQLVTSSGMRKRDVTASISGLYSLSRIITVPSPSGVTVTKEMILEAAKEVMPLNADTLYLSWQTVATGEGWQRIFVVGVPRDILDNEMRALKAAGTNPRKLDLKAMALARAVNKEQVLIFNLQPSSFDIVIVVNSIPEITRAIAWPQGDLTVEDRAEHLGLNLRLAVDFYNAHYPDTPIDPATPLIVTGYMTEDVNLMEKLQARVGYPIEPLAPPLEYPEHLPVSQYAVNIGLALNGMAPSKNPGPGGYSPPDINLLPEIYKPWKPSPRQIYIFGLIIAVIGLLVPLYQITAVAMGNTANLRAKYDIINSEMQQRQAEIRNREPLQKAINDYNTIVNMGGGLSDDLSVIQNQANKLVVEVKQISHQGNSITVTCEAPDYVTFRKYLAALEESGRFSSPIPPPEGYPYTKSGPIKLVPKTSK